MKKPRSVKPKATAGNSAKPVDAVPGNPTCEMEAICNRYRKLYAGLVFDILEQMGLPHQALSHEIMPLTLDMKLAGPAFTMKGTTTAVKDEAWRYRRIAMVKEMTYPCVEVRDRGTTPFNVALYGELTATTARAHGAVGAVVDGGTRDSGMVIAMGYPLFARYRSPVEAFGRVVTIDHQVPIRMSGELTETVIVNPGDFIFGDLDGVLVVPKDLTLPVLEEAERIAGIEDAARGDFQRGDDPIEVYKRHKRF